MSVSVTIKTATQRHWETVGQTDRRTDRRQYHANSRLYCEQYTIG